MPPAAGDYRPSCNPVNMLGMKQDLLLLPTPRKLTWLDEPAVPLDAPVKQVTDANMAREAYQLEIRRGQVVITHSSPAGAFYARQTLQQIQRQCHGSIPAVRIEDYPDFPARGVMLDISRDKVPTMQTLYELVDLLAQWKINQLQLYTEHTFAYQNHREVWQEASPMTPEEIRQLDAYCRERFIELVPNQNSFGHMERWLKHPLYHDLAEAPDGAFYFDSHRPAATLNPLDPRSIELVREIHAELLPNFSSQLFNVGCDETMELGMGKSQEACQKLGKERVYLDFLRKIHQSVSANHRTMMFWGDIILHKPELIAELPRPIIALEWGYEPDSPFDRDGGLFAQAGVPFYVCPGTSSWCSITGRTDACLANLRNAAENGLKHGAIGFLNTDWGDLGHLQYLPVSYLGLAAGAAYSWCLQTNQNLDMISALDRHAFATRQGNASMAKIALALGNVYQSCGKLISNGSVLFHLLLAKDLQHKHFVGLTREGLQQARVAIDQAIAHLGEVQMDRPDANLIKDEFRNAAAMLQLACQRGMAILEGKPAPTDTLAELIARHQKLWRARNREGGLRESIGRLENLYQ